MIRYGVIVVNRGTIECQACIKWIKKEAPDMLIRSVCLGEDPFVDLTEVERIVEEEQIDHFTIPFKASFISDKNQNVEKAWDFERHLKGLQYQKSTLIHETPKTGVEWDTIVYTFKGDSYGKQLLDVIVKFQGCLTKMDKIAKEGRAKTHSNIVLPLEKVKKEKDFKDFLQENEIVLGGGKK